MTELDRKMQFLSFCIVIGFNLLFLFSLNNFAWAHSFDEENLVQMAEEYQEFLRSRRQSAVTYHQFSKTILPNCSVHECNSSFFCYGSILAKSWHFFGLNNCTGTELKRSSAEIWTNFNELPKNMTRDQFAAFCEENFENIRISKPTTLADWTPKPSRIMSVIKDESYKEFALKLNRRWEQLARIMVPQVKNVSYGAIYVPNNFIVPGGAFSTYFYWDSYWVCKGLLFSGMDDTVLGILRNFASLIDSLGLIPNGGDVIFARRSQPPLFTQMVQDYLDQITEAEKKLQVLRELLPQMEKEMEFWLNNRSVNVEKNGGTYQLFQYHTISDCPRPEAYVQDMEDATDFPVSKARYIWKSINSAAESGWDFSSRWFKIKGNEAGNKSTIMTIDIVPVDLNAFMCANFASLEKFFLLLGNQTRSQYYGTKREDLSEAMDTVLWDDNDGIWYDYDLREKMLRKRYYISNFFPMINPERIEDYGEKLDKIWKYIQNCKAFEFPGGIPTSLVESGQQWDFPNAWAPTVHLVIEGFRKSNDKRFANLAKTIASKWVVSNFLGYEREGRHNMWEKYDVRYADGRRGGGGEYSVQKGFGWTNGVVMELLRIYGNDLISPQSKLSASKFVEAAQNLSFQSGITILASISFAFAVIIYFSYGWCRSRSKANFGSKSVPFERIRLVDSFVDTESLFSSSEEEDEEKQ